MLNNLKRPKITTWLLMRWALFAYIFWLLCQLRPTPGQWSNAESVYTDGDSAEALAWARSHAE